MLMPMIIVIMLMLTKNLEYYLPLFFIYFYKTMVKTWLWSCVILKSEVMSAENLANKSKQYI